MSLKPILKSAVKENPIQKYFVYFDEWTGEITSITNKKKESLTDPYVITEDNTAAKLMMGELNPKKYSVADLVNGYTLIPKDDALRIKKAENQLSLVPLIKNSTNVDVNLIFYVSDYLLEINLSQDVVYKMTGSRFARKFNSDDNINKSKFEFYLIAENNPFHLLGVVEVDPIKIFNDGYVLLDLNHLKTKIPLRDVRILTKRIFRDYGLKFKENYVNIDYKTRKSASRYKTRPFDKNYKNWTTFSISPSTEGWIFRCNFDDPNEHKIYRDLKIFLTGDEPTQLLDRIVIPYDKLSKNNEFIVKTKVNPLTCNMLLGEDGRNVTFKLEEIEYVKSGKY